MGNDNKCLTVYTLVKSHVKVLFKKSKLHLISLIEIMLNDTNILFSFSLNINPITFTHLHTDTLQLSFLFHVAAIFFHYASASVLVNLFLFSIKNFILMIGFNLQEDDRDSSNEPTSGLLIGTLFTERTGSIIKIMGLLFPQSKIKISFDNSIFLFSHRPTHSHTFEHLIGFLCTKLIFKRLSFVCDKENLICLAKFYSFEFFFMELRGLTVNLKFLLQIFDLMINI